MRHNKSQIIVRKRGKKKIVLHNICGKYLQVFWISLSAHWAVCASMEPAARGKRCWAHAWSAVLRELQYRTDIGYWAESSRWRPGWLGLNCGTSKETGFLQIWEEKADERPCWCLELCNRRISRENRAAMERQRAIDTSWNMRYFDKIQKETFYTMGRETLECIDQRSWFKCYFLNIT